MKAYESMYQLLENRILKEQVKPGEYLPSEHHLCQQYNMSRDTVRKALSLLMANGYIQKIQGKGSLVLKREQLRFPISGLTSYQELQHSYGYDGRTVVEKLVKRVVTPELAEKTGFVLDSSVWELVRTREIDHAKVILDRDYLLCSVIPYLDTEIGEDSIYRYFEQELHLQIAFAEKEIRIDQLRDEDRTLLDLNQNDHHIAAINSRVFLANAQQFQYTESRHRVDKFRFYDFARRNPSTY